MLDPRMIDITKLRGYSFDQLHLLPDICGLYLVMAERSVLYVGKAKDIRKRWMGGHHKGLNLGRYYDSARIVSVACPENQLNASEKMFIAWFNCPLNETITQSTRSSLRRRLKEQNMPKVEVKPDSKIDRLIKLLSDCHVEGNAPYEIKEALQIAIELKDEAIAKKDQVDRLENAFAKSHLVGIKHLDDGEAIAVLKEHPASATDLKCTAFIDWENDFNLFWDAVKKKTNKQEARRAFRKVRDVDVQTLIEILHKQQDWHMKRNGNLMYLAQPAKWLYGRRWEDDYEYI